MSMSNYLFSVLINILGLLGFLKILHGAIPQAWKNKLEEVLFND